MLNIGNKKYRNLQEQVGYNTECIEELKKAIDGLDLDDKLVIIANDTGTFNSAELETLSLPLAFISDGSKVWMKESETLTELIYKAIDIKSEEIGSAYFNIGGTKITINKTTGYYELQDDPIITTYSKAQIDSIIANFDTLKANKSGENFTGPITAPSIIEDMSGYSFTKKTPSAGTLNYHFVGIVKNGNKLTLVIFANLVFTEGQIGYENVGEFTIPASVASKIIPYYGQVLEMKYISCIVGDTFTGSIQTGAKLTKQGSQTIRVEVARYNFVANTSYNFRIEETFLLSDNLAE